MTFPVGSLAAYMSVKGAAQARQDILAVQRSLAGAGEAATAAGAAMDRSEVALAGAARSSGVAASGANKLRAAQLSVVSATERYNAVLAEGDASVGRLATAEASLIRANERVAATTRTMAGAQTKAAEATVATAGASREAAASSTRFSQATGGTVAQLGLMLGGFALLKTGLDIGRQSVEFQKQMTMIQTQAGASASEVQYMTKAVLGMAGPLATSPMELAKGMYLVESAGYRASQALDIETQAAKLAKIGNADLVETTDALVGVLQTGIVTGANAAGKTVAELNAIIGAGKMTMSDLNEALGTGIIASAKSFGISLQSVGAALALMTDQGTPAANAATHLRMAMSLLGAPTAKAAKYLTDIGISSTDAGKQVSAMQSVLQKAGVTSLTLSEDLRKPNGFLVAIQDLEKHMKSAGLSAPESAALISRAFGGGKSSAPIMQMIANLDLLHMKFDQIGAGAGNFGKDWIATTHTAAFAFKQFAVEADTAALTLVQKAMPAIGGIGHVLAVVLPAALSMTGKALHPFVEGWHAAADILGPVASDLGAVASALGPVLPVLEAVAGAALGTWLAFKGFQVARAAAFAITDFFAVVQGKAASGLSSMRAYGAGVESTLVGNSTEATLTAQIMQTEFAKIELSALQTAAAIDRAAAVEAVAFADATAASKSSTDVQVANADRAAAAALAQSRASALAATASAGAAEEAALAVNAAGEGAAIGWSAILGPVAAVGIGIGLLVAMFHRSAGASREAAAAAKAYTDALQGDGGRSSLIDSITKQLSDNKVPETLAKLNAQYTKSTVTGREFVTAIEQQGKPLDALRAKLQAVIDAGTPKSAARGNIAGMLDHNGVTAATKLLADLNAQVYGLSEATKKDLIDTKAFAGVSSSIDKVSQSTEVGTKQAAMYAQMAGIVVDKNGVAAVSAGTLSAAVTKVSGAYNSATVTGNDFLTALNTFSGSAGTAAERAALIGATLKAANGDALSFAGSLAATTTATSALADAFAQQRQQLAQQSADQAKAADGITKAHRASETAAGRLSAAQARLDQVRGHAKSTAAQIRAAEAGVTSAQNASANSADTLRQAQANAGQAGALAYVDTERAALKFTKTAHGLTAEIVTTAKGAGDLVSQLQGMQTAAMGAAQAMFQHEVATKGAKAAADDAYNVYVQKTRQALIDQASKLGLTKDQAVALADAYFGMPADVKTKIESEGTDPILTVLSKISDILAFIAGKPWSIKVNADTRAAELKIIALQNAKDRLTGNVSAKSAGTLGSISQIPLPGKAAGGLISGAGTGTSDTAGAYRLADHEFVSTAASVMNNYRALQAGNLGAKLGVVRGGDGASVQPMTPVSGGRGQVVNIVQNISYPEPETVTRLTPRALRMAAIPLAGA